MCWFSHWQSGSFWSAGQTPSHLMSSWWWWRRWSPWMKIPPADDCGGRVEAILNFILLPGQLCLQTPVSGTKPFSGAQPLASWPHSALSQGSFHFLPSIPRRDPQASVSQASHQLPCPMPLPPQHCFPPAGDSAQRKSISAPGNGRAAAATRFCMDFLAPINIQSEESLNHSWCQ